MQFLKKKVEELRPLFKKGGKYEKFHTVYDAHETLVFQPDEVAGDKGSHIRDIIDVKRMMTTVIIALLPCMIFGMYNSGYQHYYHSGIEASFIDMIWFGALKFLPILAVSYATGLGIEFLWASYLKHPVAEGFLVSGILIPLILPSTIPLWQVAVAVAFAVIIGKEVFGGVGMNLLNPALTARAFLFFAYPSQISGDKVWIDIDGFSGATVLGQAAGNTAYEGSYTFMDMFLGFIPGSIGETSVLMCLIGAAILIFTKVGSARIMLSMVLGALAMGWLVEVLGANFFGIEHFYYHIVAGGFAFGVVFMATDPVSAAQTSKGKLYYGFFAGVFSILIRVLNPAYPEGVMLAILLLNVFAPLIDYFVVEANKTKRIKRATV